MAARLSSAEIASAGYVEIVTRLQPHCAHIEPKELGRLIKKIERWRADWVEEATSTTWFPYHENELVRSLVLVPHEGRLGKLYLLLNRHTEGNDPQCTLAYFKYVVDYDTGERLVMKRLHSLETLESAYLKKYQGNPLFAKMHFEVHHQKSDGELLTYVGLKYYPRGSLTDYLQREKPSLKTRYVIIGRLLEAVALMHREGHIHGDLTGDNILVDEDGSAVLADFSTASLEKEDRGKERLWGTPSHLSPHASRIQRNLQEGKEENSREGATKENDIWALGCTFYLLWTEQRLPWDGLRPKETRAAIALYLGRRHWWYPEPREGDTVERLIWEMTYIFSRERLSIEQALEKYRRIRVMFESTV